MRLHVDNELLSRFAALELAIRERDLLERQLRAGGGDEQLRALSLTACERVVAERTALYRCLIRQGWTPPDPLVRHLLNDEVLLDEPVGSAGA